MDRSNVLFLFCRAELPVALGMASLSLKIQSLVSILSIALRWNFNFFTIV